MIQKNSLLKNSATIIRILEVRNEQVLCVDCVHKSMPKWVDTSELNSFTLCTEQDLPAVTNNLICDYDDLSKENRRIAHERFTMIAGILLFVGNEKMRSSLIAQVVVDRNISKQTVRHYLWMYLAYQNIAALAPKQKRQERPLTQDEKNIRWALNKFYYTKHKNSLNTAYTMMLKSKYCDAKGKLNPAYPSIHQFKYFYRKHKKLQTYYISREGIKSYQRNHRPLLGDGVQEFAPCIGTGMLDSTICDIYLVNEAGELVGRPILTACIDAYSGLCCGYTLSWEGGVYSLRSLLTNVITNKVDWCKQFGITINLQDWNCSSLPATLVTDMGNEYKSETFEQLAELGITIVNLPPYRPELKGIVEKFFDLIQTNYKKHLKGKGVIEPDFQERGVHDYRKDACLTMHDFEKIILHCIIYYNSKRIIEDFPFTQEMLTNNVQPCASSIWNWSISQAGSNLISVNYKDLILTLLPRTTGKFSRDGLKVNKLRYKNNDFTERYLRGGIVTVAYNPNDVSKVWLLEGGIYTDFLLSESRYKGLNRDEVDLLQEAQKTLEKSLRSENLQAQIDLAEHIETIANAAIVHGNVNVKAIRNTRKKEQRRTHIDHMKGGTIHE